MDPVIVELKEWTQRLPTRSRKSVRRRSVVSLVVGGLLVLLGVAGAVASVALDGPSIRLLGAAFLAVSGGLMIWNAVRYLKHLPRGGDDDPVQFAAPFAFSISDDSLHFPPRFDISPEEWPLAATVVEVRPDRSGPLVLRCPGKRTRRYLPSALVRSPAEISRLIEDRRAATRH